LTVSDDFVNGQKSRSQDQTTSIKL